MLTTRAREFKLYGQLSLERLVPDDQFYRHLEGNLDLAQTYRSTEPYLKAIHKCRVWVEPLFTEAKEWHSFHRFRLHKLPNVNIQAIMTASGQNLKHLIAAQGWGVSIGQ